MVEKFFKALKIVIILCALTVNFKNYAASATWAQPQNGNWSDASKWTAGGPPNGAGQTATFGSNYGFTPAHINIDAGFATVGSIIFDNLHSVVLQQTTGSLVLDNSGSGATINLVVIDALQTPNFTISAPISLSDNLQINRPTGVLSLDISGVISGNHNITINNAGTNPFSPKVTFTGNNSYTGTTSVIQGVLTLQNNGSINSSSAVSISAGATLSLLGSVAGGPPNYTFNNLTGNGTLDITLPISNNKTVIIPSGNFSGVIEGTSGKIEKTSAGLLILTGVNTYGGGTTVSNGTLQVGADNNLGDASGDVTLSGSGILNTTASFTSSRTFQSPDTGTIDVSVGPLTLTGVLQDQVTSGKFVKEGAGTLILEGTNTYTGGLEVNAGVLQGTTDSIRGDVLNNTSVVFDQTGTGTYSAVMSGPGTLTNAGTGTVTLTGANTYSGGTTISDGILQVSADANLGAASGNVTLSGSGILNTTASFTSNRTFQSPDTATLDVSAGTVTLTGVLQNQVTSGEFIKEGAGTLVLQGSNTYSGGTTINHGTLQVSMDDNLGDVSGDVTLSSPGVLNTTASFTSNRTFQSPDTATLDVSAGTLTLAGVLQNQVTSGEFVKEGAGTLVLQGSNTYSGGTTINNGTLQVSMDDNLGDASGDVTLSGSGVLNTIATFTSNRTFQTPDTATLDVNGLTTLTLTGLLQDQSSFDQGKFIKNGMGTLVLQGANSYRGGTTVNAGVLQGTTTGIQGDILNNASVVFDQGGAGPAYTGMMSGTGSLTKISAGTVKMTGVNSYTGGTTVSGGVLEGNTDSLQGNIFNNATLTFDQARVTAFQGTIHGTGVLNKQKTGILIMNGAHPFSGTTNINVGGLLLNGSIAGPVNVATTGVLGGNAQVGDLTNAGLVVPGFSIGVITVNGTYTQTNTGTLSIQIRASGENDLLNVIGVPGTAALDGRLIVEAIPGLYDGTETYEIITATGGVGGTFAQEIALGNLIYQLNYMANSVVLNNQYVGPILPISPANIDGNPKSVAEYLFCAGLVPSNPDLVDVMIALLSLPPDEFVDALDRLHPAQFGALPLVVLQNSHMVANTMVSTTTDWHDCERCQESSCPSRAGQSTFWLTPIGQWQTQKATEDQLGFNAQTYGGTAGISHLFASWVNVALGGGYTYTDLGWKGNAGDGHWNSFYLGPSVGFIGKNWFVLASVIK